MIPWDRGRYSLLQHHADYHAKYHVELQQVGDVLPLWLLYSFDEDLGFEELPCEAWIPEDGLALLGETYRG